MVLVRGVRKMLLLGAVVSLLFAVWPMQPAYGAKVEEFYGNFEYGNGREYLIAGETYELGYWTDANLTTSIDASFSYSVDNGISWIPLPTVPCDYLHCFSLPVTMRLTNAMFRIDAYFVPLLGSNTRSEKTIGPYRVLQPGIVSDFTATPNNDGSVTLNWNDNSDMESYYRITRSGPDGEKTFVVKDTMDHFGPLSYADKETNKSKETVYMYKLNPVVDAYPVSETEVFGEKWALAKTKVPFDLKKERIIDRPIVPELIDKLDPETPINEIQIYDYIVDVPLTIGDIGKPAASGVKLDRRAIALKPGETDTLAANVSPADAANRNVTWTVDHPEIAEVDGSGKVTAKSPGITFVTVKTEIGGFTDRCVVTVLANPEPQPPMLPAATFPDIEGHKARAEIERAAAFGILSGYPDGTFRPEGKVTRAEFASMVVRALNAAGQGAPLMFKDKDDIPNWATIPVRQAVELGFISGYPDGTFRPNANISHAEMVSMVIRASGLPESDAPKTGFADDAELPKWARPAVSKAEETGIIIVGGLPDGKFRPKALTTRAEAASAIVRMLDAMND